jgi:hypothetical protein
VRKKDRFTGLFVFAVGAVTFNSAPGKPYLVLGIFHPETGVFTHYSDRPGDRAMTG